MCFVVIRYHDRISHRLCDYLVAEIFYGEHHLKSEFLILMPAIASYSHRQLDLHRARRRRWGLIGRLTFIGHFEPLFQLTGVEYNNPLLFVLLEHLLFFGLLLLLARSSFPLTLNATSADFDFTTIQRLLIIISG